MQGVYDRRAVYYDAGGEVENEWLIELWQNFEDKVRKEFKLDV